jgi:cytochrome c
MRIASKPKKSYRAIGKQVGVIAGLLLWAGVMAGALAQTAVSPVAPAREWVTPATGDVQRGSALYQSRCTACHAIDSNKYSDEVAQSRLRWTPQTLNAWLEDPEELVKGQRMGFQVDSAQERADLIAYLATLK